MSKHPISLIIDDGGVINTFFFHDLSHRHEFLVPPAFAMQFGKICQKYGVKGKLSVVPMPCGLGRLDEPGKVNMVPEENVHAFIDYTKKYIMPNFSITPELLTHFLAWNMKNNCKESFLENSFIDRLNAEEVADYIGSALQILVNCGLTPEGVTSPWTTGCNTVDAYSRGIGMACKRVLGLDRTFYFCGEPFTPRPVVRCDSAESGKVVQISHRSRDPFWGTMNPATTEEAHIAGRQGIDNLISEDGRSGLLRELYEAGDPLVFLTHWQSLYSDGRAIGLYWFEELLQRLQRVFGKDIEWVTTRELAEIYCP